MNHSTAFLHETEKKTSQFPASNVHGIQVYHQTQPPMTFKWCCKASASHDHCSWAPGIDSGQSDDSRILGTAGCVAYGNSSLWNCR